MRRHPQLQSCWGQVEEYCFSRSLSYDAVPSKGLYPLGLGELVEQCCFTVDELFAQQQYQQFLAAQQASLQLPPPPPPVAIVSPTTGKKKSTTSTTTTATTNTTTNTTVVSKSRERKDSFDLTQIDHSSSTSTTTSTTSETVSISRSPQVKAESERMQMLREVVDVSKKNTDGKGLHQELETIRKSREHYGCSCKPVKLDKLNVAKLKSELQHRRHLINPSFTEDVEKLKKTELMHYLKEALKACPSCIVDQCECIEAGIPCSANACDCVYRPGEPESCENPLGNKSYNEEHVKEYRQRILAQVKMSLQMDDVAMENKHQ